MSNDVPDFVYCCGEDRNTPFCSECGKQLATKAMGIAGLLAHLRRTIDVHNKRLKAQELHMRCLQKEANEKAWEYQEKRRERRQRTLAKWQTWHKALIDLIKHKKAGAVRD